MKDDRIDIEEERFCEISILLNFITNNDGERYLWLQEKEREKGINKKIGQYLFEAKVMTVEQIDIVLKISDDNHRQEKASMEHSRNSLGEGCFCH